VFLGHQRIFMLKLSMISKAKLWLLRLLLKKIKKKVSGSDIKAAEKIGQLIAERAKKVGIDKVIFDRSGYLYHGRVKALAEKARENGLQF